MLSIAFAVSIYTIYAYQIRKADIISALDSRLIAAVQFGAEIIDENVINDAAQGRMSQTAFYEYQRKLYRYARAADVEYVYGFVESAEGYRFVLETINGEEYRSGKHDREAMYVYGLEDDRAKDALALAFKGGKPDLMEYTDEWGEHRGLFRSFTTASGTRFVVGADLSSAVIDTALRQTLYATLGIGLVLFVVTSLVSFLIISQFMKPVDAAQQAVCEIADKMDLRQRVQGGGDEIGRLCGCLNYLLDRLQGLISKAGANANENAAISERLDATGAAIYESAIGNLMAVSKVALQGEQASQMLGKMLERLEQIDGEINRIGAIMAGSKEKIVNVALLARKESAAQQELSAHLARLSHDADQVQGVLNIIGDIADQTNLLALNAAIEAARAGQNGRGFAVVADEVRKLAERTQRSLSETGPAISAIIQSIGDVSNKMEQSAQKIAELLDGANEAQNSIEVSAAEIADTQRTLHESANDSRNILEHTQKVLGAVAQIGQRTDKSTQNIKEISESASYLHKVSKMLNDELAQFKA